MKILTKQLVALTSATIICSMIATTNTIHKEWDYRNITKDFMQSVEDLKADIREQEEEAVSEIDVIDEPTPVVASPSPQPETIKVEQETMSEIVISEHEKYLTVPSGHPFKSFERYNMITCVTSPQYKLQQQAYTCENGLRAVNGAYCVAIGTGFNLPVGSYFTLVMANGSEIECIVGDIKSDSGTDSTRKYHLYDGSVVEFIVDYDVLSDYAKIRGDISYLSPEFSGEVLYFKVKY